MIRTPTFWQDEANAPLLTLERNHFREHHQKVLDLAHSWRHNIFKERVNLQQEVHKPIGRKIKNT